MDTTTGGGNYTPHFKGVHPQESQTSRADVCATQPRFTTLDRPQKAYLDWPNTFVISQAASRGERVHRPHCAIHAAMFEVFAD